jgi:hypothetical protein
MKHGIVVYNQNVSNSTVELLGTNDPRAGSIDCSKPNTVDSILRGYNKNLRTPDGIQIYHFKNKFPRGNTGQFLGPEHLEYWSRALTDRLTKRGEKLDFVILPEPSANGPLAYGKLLDWFKELKEQWPEIRIIANRPEKGSGYGEAIEFTPLEPAKGERIPTLEGFEIKPYIDLALHTPKTGPHPKLADELRAQLGMPAYSATKGRG